MKKFIMCMFVALAAGMMVSCEKSDEGIDPNQDYCWEVVMTISAYGQSYDDAVYFWGTESDVKLVIKEAKEDLADEDLEGFEVTFSYDRVDASASECEALNKY